MSTATFSGTGPLLRFLLRRELTRLPWWLLGAAFLIGYQSVGSQSIYDTPEKLARFRETIGGSTAMVAMSGPRELLATIGGEVLFEVFAYTAVVVALMNMFLVSRYTRSDEESGRAELIRSARVGRHAPLAAALCMAALANGTVAVVVFAAAAGTGLPVGGSLLTGVAIATVGLTFAALAAVAAQVFESPRAVYGAVGLALAGAFVLRAVGDAGNGALSWLSPIGWGQRTFPFVGERWWPLLLPIGTSTLLVMVAVALVDRRDFGAGLVPTRLGRARASRALGTPIGLAWRLQRGALIGWMVGTVLMGAAFGSLGNSIEQFAIDNPEVAQFLGGAANIVDSYLAFSLAIWALAASAYGVSAMLRVRGEETAGRAEPVLATATSRSAWLASHLTVGLTGSALVLVGGALGLGVAHGIAVADAGQAPGLVVAALVWLPAVWLVVGIAVLSLGWLPRVAAVVAWVVVGYCAIIALFADSFDLPNWIGRASPFAHTPQTPLETVTAPPLLIITGIVVAVVVGGFAGFRNRDLGY